MMFWDNRYSELLEMCKNPAWKHYAWHRINELAKTIPECKGWPEKVKGEMNVESKPE